MLVAAGTHTARVFAILSAGWIVAASALLTWYYNGSAASAVYVACGIDAAKNIKANPACVAHYAAMVRTHSFAWLGDGAWLLVVVPALLPLLIALLAFRSAPRKPQAV
jgi:hypothetical protein